MKQTVSGEHSPKYTKWKEPEQIFTRLLLGHSLWTFYKSVRIGWCRWCSFLTPNLSPSPMETCLPALLLPFLSFFLLVSICLSASHLHPLFNVSVYLVIFKLSHCHYHTPVRDTELFWVFFKCIFNKVCLFNSEVMNNSSYFTFCGKNPVLVWHDVKCTLYTSSLLSALLLFISLWLRPV